MWFIIYMLCKRECIYLESFSFFIVHFYAFSPSYNKVVWYMCVCVCERVGEFLSLPVKSACLPVNAFHTKFATWERGDNFIYRNICSSCFGIIWSVQNHPVIYSMRIAHKRFYPTENVLFFVLCLQKIDKMYSSFLSYVWWISTRMCIESVTVYTHYELIPGRNIGRRGGEKVHIGGGGGG